MTSSRAANGGAHLQHMRQEEAPGCPRAPTLIHKAMEAGGEMSKPSTATDNNRQWHSEAERGWSDERGCGGGVGGRKGRESVGIKCMAHDRLGPAVYKALHPMWPPRDATAPSLGRRGDRRLVNHLAFTSYRHCQLSRFSTPSSPNSLDDDSTLTNTLPATISHAVFNSAVQHFPSFHYSHAATPSFSHPHPVGIPSRVF